MLHWFTELMRLHPIWEFFHALITFTLMITLPIWHWLSRLPWSRGKNVLSPGQKGAKDLDCLIKTLEEVQTWLGPEDNALTVSIRKDLWTIAMKLGTDVRWFRAFQPSDENGCRDFILHSCEAKDDITRKRYIQMLQHIVDSDNYKESIKNPARYAIAELKEQLRTFRTD